MKYPVAIVLAGPNGAGKSTLAPRLLRDAFGIREFVNADQIAVGLSAYSPETAALEAGRVMLERLHSLAARRVSFAFESTLASRSPARFLAGLRKQGYRVEINYVMLDSPELAVARVAARVRAGGHSIAEDVIRRRFGRSAANLLDLYLPLADRGRIINNSSGKLDRVATLASHQMSRRLIILDHSSWTHLNALASKSSSESIVPPSSKSA